MVGYGQKERFQKKRSHPFLDKVFVKACHFFKTRFVAMDLFFVQAAVQLHTAAILRATLGEHTLLGGAFDGGSYVAVSTTVGDSYAVRETQNDPCSWGPRTGFPSEMAYDQFTPPAWAVGDAPYGEAERTVDCRLTFYGVDDDREGEGGRTSHHAVVRSGPPRASDRNFTAAVRHTTRFVFPAPLTLAGVQKQLAASGPNYVRDRLSGPWGTQAMLAAFPSLAARLDAPAQTVAVAYDCYEPWVVAAVKAATPIPIVVIAGSAPRDPKNVNFTLF